MPETTTFASGIFHALVPGRERLCDPVLHGDAVSGTIKSSGGAYRRFVRKYIQQCSGQCRANVKGFDEE